jgi:glucose-6-phosphate 1-epimerase
MTISQLNARYRIQDQIVIEDGNGGMPFIRVQNESADALISVYGGQILSFKPKDQANDMLFLSAKSLYQEGQAIRGGIPVCWPWFGPDPKGLHRPNHGFVRNHFWTVIGTSSTASESQVMLQFTDKNKLEKTWKSPFTLILEIRVGKMLELKLTTQNTGEHAFSITQAFHAYFNIGDISQVQVLGLAGCPYFDKLDQGKEKIQIGDVTISEETDRIYEDIDHPVILVDPVFKRRIEIVSKPCRTGVVWNPWRKSMTDLGDQDYQRFVCVETGNIAFDLVQVPPGGESSLLTSYKVMREDT